MNAPLIKNCKHKWVEFDGNKPHMTEKISSGYRYTIVSFTQQKLPQGVTADKTQGRQASAAALGLAGQLQ